jgi:hypothetical protein
MTQTGNRHQVLEWARLHNARTAMITTQSTLDHGTNAALLDKMNPVMNLLLSIFFKSARSEKVEDGEVVTPQEVFPTIPPDHKVTAILVHRQLSIHLRAGNHGDINAAPDELIKSAVTMFHSLGRGRKQRYDLLVSILQLLHTHGLQNGQTAGERAKWTMEFQQQTTVMKR